METTTNTQATSTEVKPLGFRKSVLEMYVEATDKASKSNKSAQQVSASGNEFSGLNNVILATVKAELGFKSNIWYSDKQMKDAGLMVSEEDNYGTVVFTTKLVDIEGSTKKETVLRYWNVWNKDELEVLPL